MEGEVWQLREIPMVMLRILHPIMKKQIPGCCFYAKHAANPEAIIVIQSPAPKEM